MGGLAAIYQMPKVPKLQLFRSSTLPQPYQPLKSIDEEHFVDEASSPRDIKPDSIRTTRGSLVTMLIAGFFALAGVVVLTRASYLEQRAASSSASLASASASATVPQYFQTSPEIYAGKEARSSGLQYGIH